MKTLKHYAMIDKLATMEEAKKILDKHIQNFYKKNPMARFDDIPNKVFIEAMIEYGRLAHPRRKTRYDF